MIYNQLMVRVTAVLIFCSVSFSAMAQPTFTKVFSPNTIGPGSVTTLTFIIDNTSSAATVTDLAFIDVLPTVPGDVDVADPANIQTDCDMGSLGSITAPDGGGTITLTGAQIGSGELCFISVDVTASTPGIHTNTTGDLTSSAGNSGTATDDLNVVTTLPGFSKSFAPSSVPVGDRSTLTFTIDNSLNASRIGNLDFTDNFPTGLEIASPSNASTDCISAGFQDTTLTAIPGSNQVILDANGSNAVAGFEVLPVGASCFVTVDVVASGVGLLDNITGDLLSDFVSAGKASASLESTITPIAITKEFIDDPVPPGGFVELVFTLSNFDRNFAATGVDFTDDLNATLAGLSIDSVLENTCGGMNAAGGALLSYQGGSIPAESNCVIRLSLAVPAAAMPGVYTNITSTVTGTLDGSPVVGNMASDDLFVEPVPVLTKEFLEVGTLAPDPVVNPGDDVVLRFTVTNTSTTSGATNITFLDELTDGGLGTGFLPFPVVVALPPVPDPPCGAGSSLALTFVDTDRQGLSLTGGTVAAAGMAGDSCTFDVTLTIPSTMPAGIYTNTTEEITATVDGATRTGLPASDTLTVLAAPSLSKAFTDDPVAPGGTVTLEFSLENSPNSPSDATGISFTDDLNATLTGLSAVGLPLLDICGMGSSISGTTSLSFTGGTLAAGENCTFSVTLNVPIGAAPGAYTNTSSGVSATVAGLAAVSNPATDNLNVSGLNFTKEFLDDPVIAGDSVTLRFTINNIHPTEAATGIFFTDSLSAVLPGLAATGLPLNDVCGVGSSISGTTFLIMTGGNLLAGESCTFDVTVDVPGGTNDGVYPNVTSFLSATQGGAVTAEPAVDDLIVNSSLLQLTKQFTDDPVAPGDSVTLEFTLTNLDPGQAASAISFTDDLGAALAGLVFNTEDFNDCSATVAGTGTDMINVTGASLVAGGSCTISLSLTVPGAAVPGLYTNTTSDLTGDIGGFAVDGDSASDELEVINIQDFTKSFDGPATASGTATLTFTITNPGPTAVTSLSFSDDLNAVIPGMIATSLPPAPCGVGSSISGMSLLTFSGGELAAMGGTCSFDVEVLIPAAATAGVYPNTTSDLFEFGLKVADPATADLTIEPPPTFAKVFAPDFVGVTQGVSTLTLTIDNTASALAASSLDFTDNLPAGVELASPANASTTCTGGTVTATAGTAVISYTGGSVAAGASCTVQVDTIATAVGVHVNTTGDLTSSSGNSGTATDTLTANPQPTFAKGFAPNPSALGVASTLTFTVDNTASSVDATSLDFTDNLPAGMTVAATPNASTTCTGGTLTAVANSSTVSYTGASVTAGASCTVSVDVTTNSTGDFVNTSGDLTSNLGISGTATDTLTVFSPPVFSKAFVLNAIPMNGVSTLTFTIDNSGNTLDATNLDFTDNFPAAVSVAATPNASTTCTGGTVTAVANSGVISYSGGTLAAGVTCTLSVDVTSATLGSHLNTTGDLTSSLGNSGPASATLTVTELPILSKAFATNPDVINNVNTLTFTIDNTSGTVDGTGLAFNDPLPAGLLVATPANPSNTCTGGTLTAADGSSSIDYSGGTVVTGASCTISVDVIATASGVHNNVTSVLTTDFGISNFANASLTIESPPLFTKAFAPATIATNAVSTLTFTIDNTANTLVSSGLDFTDNLPAGMVVANPNNASTTCTGGIGPITAVTGTSIVNYSGGGSVGAGTSCTISVDVTSATVGNYLNTTGDLTGIHGNSGTANATLVVTDVTLFSKSFAPAVIVQNGVSTLTFTIDNGASLLDAGSLDFADSMPVALLIASPANVVNTCGGTVTAITGSSNLSFTGGTVLASSSCTVSVDVTSSVIGTHSNVSGDLTSSLGNSGTATADLMVETGLIMTKVFSNVEPIFAGDNVEMTFTLSNNSSFDATNISFSDDLDGFISGAVAIGLPIVDVCGAGSNLSGSSIVTLVNGSVPANSSCQFSVTVSVPVTTTEGTYINTTSSILADIGGSTIDGGVSSSGNDTLYINGAVQVIPILSQWMLILMISLIFLTMVWFQYRRKFD